MDNNHILTETREDGVATVTLNRAEVHNAFNDTVIADLTGVLRRLGDDYKVRAVVLRAEGKSFSAGADLGWMQRMAGYGHAENLADAGALAKLMRVLNFLPKPTVARVQGSAFGGGGGRGGGVRRRRGRGRLLGHRHSVRGRQLQPVGGSAWADPGRHLSLCRG